MPQRQAVFIYTRGRSKGPPFFGNPYIRYVWAPWPREGFTVLASLRLHDALWTRARARRKVHKVCEYPNPIPYMSLGYGLVVPFPAYGFAALVSNNEDLNSLNSEV